ncbi:extracellular solute-binding protein [Lactobacillus sp. ESL0791]|uniref:extracellular solute-binding protein n=1 Tax=Lactobacillus sp. ESL0791 TaxID=2983234 RepID=UPI0023F996E6|nr:extracellular solute-binding protein [Lactobacillus sp. ESL0791]MDF7638221.1 extracellular solute-binding protein [Lactobacillus sp. ESL0791]
MKLNKKWAVAAVAALALMGTAACSNGKSNSSSSGIPSKIDKKTTVVFWHGMQGDQATTLKKLTAEFEKKNPNINVKLEGQGSYSESQNDLQAKINSTLQSPKNLPTITQAYPDWLTAAAKNKMLVDLTPYINNKDVGWGSVKASGIRSDLLSGATINGKQYGIPFNKSTEIMIYNKDMFKKYGIKQVPTTMAELKQDAQTIYKKSNHQVVGAGFDSLSNYYVLGMKDEGVDFSKNIDFAGSTSKKVLNYYADGIKDGYFRMPGSDKYLYIPFTNKKVAMIITSSSTETWVKGSLKNKFTYDVAARPGKYTMGQGTDIYMFKQASAMQKAAAFKYMRFLVSKESQLTWAKATGYIPVNSAAAESSEYKDNKDLKLPAQLENAMTDLYSVPVVKDAGATYGLLNPIMQNILAAAQKKQNIDNAIKSGKTKFDASWKQ